MIFYTLLTYYPEVDRANIVLTAMIVYIIIYLAIPEELTFRYKFVAVEWNLIVLVMLAVLDFFLLSFPPNKLKAKLFETFKFNFNFNFNFFSSKSKEKSRKRRHRRRHVKKVRFAKVNQYHEYQPWDGFARVMTSAPSTQWFRMQPEQTRGTGFGYGAPAAAPMGGVPSWQLTPQQQLQQKLWSQYQTQMAAASAHSAMPMIDNRHLLKEMEAAQSKSYLHAQSDEESVASDQSSDLSNSEEGFDF